MLYPMYVHHEAGSAYGATFPDFPGCFAAADEIQDLTKAAQEAVEAHFGADSDPIPAPTSPDVWANDEDYQGGFWMMVDIDLSKVRSKAVRLNITLPERLVQSIDAYAASHHLSRSAFLASAAERAMQAHAR